MTMKQRKVVGRKSRSGWPRVLRRWVLFGVMLLALWWGRGVDRSDLRPEAGFEPAGSGEVNEEGYRVLKGARLVDHRRNDGDSFFVAHRGAEYEMRLYFVDCPEKYMAEHNAKRLGHQARYFGGSGLKEMVEVGLEAKEFTRRLLAKRPFDVHTNWEGVYGNDRHYCFVVLEDGSYLSGHLVTAGLARIYTKGEPAPDGRSVKQFKRHLQGLEQEAKQAGRGAWGLRQSQAGSFEENTR